MKKQNNKVIYLTPCAYKPIGKGLAIVSIDDLLKGFEVQKKEIIEKMIKKRDKVFGNDNYPVSIRGGYDFACQDFIKIIKKI